MSQLAKGQSPVQNQLIGIVGMGYLSKAIAACFLAHGIGVIVHSQGAGWRDETQNHIGDSLAELARRGGIETDLLSNWRSRYHEAQTIADLCKCTFMLESVPENL